MVVLVLRNKRSVWNESTREKRKNARSKDMEAPKNDRKNMRKGPKIYNK